MKRFQTLATALALLASFFAQPARAQSPSLEEIMARADLAMRPVLDSLTSLDYEMKVTADAYLQFLFIKGTATRTVRYREGKYYYEKNNIQSNIPFIGGAGDEEWLINGNKGWHRRGNDLVEEYKKARVDSLLERRKGKGAFSPMEKAASKDSIFQIDRWKLLDEDTLAGHMCYRLELLPKKVVKDSFMLAYEAEMEGRISALEDSTKKDSTRTLFYIDKQDFRFRGVVVEIVNLKAPGALAMIGNPIEGGFKMRVVALQYFEAPMAWMPKQIRMDMIAPGNDYIHGYINVEMLHYQANGEVSKDLFEKPEWANELKTPPPGPKNPFSDFIR